MAELLLQTKLSVPPLRTELVARPRLLERLDASLRPGHKQSARIGLKQGSHRSCRIGSRKG